jgi:hypothetical protein
MAHFERVLLIDAEDDGFGEAARSDIRNSHTLVSVRYALLRSSSAARHSFDLLCERHVESVVRCCARAM